MELDTKGFLTHCGYCTVRVRGQRLPVEMSLYTKASQSSKIGLGLGSGVRGQRLPVEVFVYKGVSEFQTDLLQGLYRVFKRCLRVQGSEGAEVMGPHQQGGSVAHRTNIQVTVRRKRRQGAYVKG